MVEMCLPYLEELRLAHNLGPSSLLELTSHALIYTQLGETARKMDGCSVWHLIPH